jgi:hypothetical protein
MSRSAAARAAATRAKKKRKRRKKACTPAQAKKVAKAQRRARRRKKPYKGTLCKPKRRTTPKPPSPTSPLSAPATTPAQPAGGSVPPPASPPSAPPSWQVDSPIAKYSGTFGVEQAERLLWRAGFGPRRGEAAELAALGLERAVTHFTRPQGPAVLTGPEPTTAEGYPISPIDKGGDDHVYWLDRMVRSDQQLVERLTLVFHDWFATSLEAIHLQEWILEQMNLFRQHGLGSFKELISAITVDRAMIYWLSSEQNLKGQINENYARELMELFTLGANRGAYTERDVREAARALSGFKATWDDGYPSFFTFTPANHDDGIKTIFGQTGSFTWTDVCRMVVEHPMHPGFFVTKLWSYFIPTPPTDAVRTALEQLYVSSGYQIRPLMEAILCSPELYTGARMVKPPVVYNAGMLRARGLFVARSDWYWYSMMAGQRLFWPPDVSGWDDKRWLDTNTLRARWAMASTVFLGQTIGDLEQKSYELSETPQQSVAKALEFWGDPSMSQETVAELVAFAEKYAGTSLLNARRQNVLRQLIPCTPDYLTC